MKNQQDYIKKLELEIEELKADKEERLEWESFKLKRDTNSNVAYLDDAIIVGSQEYKELTFRRPLGKDMRKIGGESGLDATNQLARLLCKEIETVSNEEFDEMDYGNVLKYIYGVVEGFM